MFRCFRAYSFAKHPVGYSIMRAAVVFTLLSFITSIVLPSNASAILNDAVRPPATPDQLRDIYSDLRDGLFDLPDDMGYVQDSYTGTGPAGERVIVHIQDAHCDFFAQKAIARIITHLKARYGVSFLCLEGGAGEYDLSPFTDIREDKLRGKVGEFFLAEGMMNGAEYAAVSAPGAYTLWGIEEEELYKRNLKVYRDSTQYRPGVEDYLSALAPVLEELKKRIYSEELYQLDAKYSQYKNGELPLKEYLKFLFSQATANIIPFKQYRNIFLLKEVMEAEAGIDFRKANTERDSFVEALRGKISRNQLEDLVQRTLRFQSGGMTQKEYYNYLLEEGKKAGLDIAGYPSFKQYIVYISIYTSIDKSAMLLELGQLEETLRKDLCADERQAKLLSLSKNFTLVNKAFDIQMTKTDFDYYKENMGSFRSEDLVAFIKKEVPACGITARVPDDKIGLDDRLRDIEQFYEISFERDGAFLSNMKSKMDATGYRSVVLVTGGFHTENLSELLRREGYSYVTVLPKFKDKEGYKNPYFDILAGGAPPAAKMLGDAVAASMMQVASLWNRLGMEVDGVSARNKALLMVEMAKKLAAGEKAVVAVRGSPAVITFSMDASGKISYTISKDEPGAAFMADVLIKDAATMEYENHEAIIDAQLEKAYAEGRASAVDPKIISSVAAFFRAIGKPGIAAAVEKGAIALSQVKGITLFDGHASWRGISVSGELSPEEQAAVIVHEIGAYLKQVHTVNEELQGLYGKFVMPGMGKENGAAVQGRSEEFAGLSLADRLTAPGSQEGRDYAALEELLGADLTEMLEKLLRQNGLDPASEGGRLLMRGLAWVDRVLEEDDTDARISRQVVMGMIVSNERVRDEVTIRQRLYELIRGDAEIQGLIAKGRAQDITPSVLGSRGLSGVTGADVRMFTDVLNILAEQTGRNAGYDRNDILRAADELINRANTMTVSEQVENIVRARETSEIGEGIDLESALPASPSRGVISRDFPDATQVNVGDVSIEAYARTETGTPVRVKVNILVKGERMSAGLLASIRENAARSAAGFVDAEKLAEFLSGWEINTIENNDAIPGYVDAAGKKIYVTENIRVAARVSPQILPMIILAETARPGRYAEGFASQAGIRASSDKEAATFVMGLEPARDAMLNIAIKDLNRQSTPINLETLNRAIAARRAVVEEMERTGRISRGPVAGLTPEEQALIALNSGRTQPGEGLLDRLFGENVRAGEVIDVMKNADDTEHSSRRVAETLLKLNAGSWVCFADGMAGKARESYMGGPIMDRLSPEATKVLLNFAVDRGLFVFHFGMDEHAFVFPETFTENDIRRFFLDAMEEMKKESGYVLYSAPWDRMPPSVGKVIESLTEEGVDVVWEQLAGEYHVLVPKEYLAALQGVLQREAATPMKIYPFLMPAGGVRLEAPEKMDLKGKDLFTALLGKAEKESGQKWRADEVAALSPMERQKLWDSLTRGQRKAVMGTAWRKLGDEAKKGLKSADQLSIDQMIVNGLPGFNKSAVSLSRAATLEEEKIDVKNVLKEPLSLELGRDDMSMTMRTRIDKVFRRAERYGRAYKYDPKDPKTQKFNPTDPYTSYNSRMLEDLVAELLTYSPEEISKMDPKERLFMVRGPPIDFYLVALNDDGSITMMNMDVMCHAESLSGEARDALIKELQAGLGGRTTDYIVPATISREEAVQRARAIEEAYENLKQGKISWSRMKTVLEANGTRVFPFKALNTVYTHSVADQFILTHGVNLYTAFAEQIASRGMLTEEAIKEALIAAHAKARNGIDEEKFQEAVDGKPLADAMYEVHVVNLASSPDPARAAKEAVNRLQAMGKVRDPGIVRADGEIVGNMQARVRTEREGMREAYGRAFQKQQEFAMRDGASELDDKVAFMSGHLEKERTALEGSEVAGRVKEMYSSGRGVISNITDMTTPLVVFIQCPYMSESQETSISKQVARTIAKKYNAKANNLRIVFYSDKTDLETKIDTDPVIGRMLAQDKARGVVFSMKHAGIHPKGNVSKDLFAAVRTLDGKPKVYYVEESYEGFAEGETPDPLVGPHVALALGIKEFKAGNTNPALLRSINTLISEISGTATELESAADIISFLERILDSGEALKIKKIDFETLKDQIAAEEAALISL